ncbi:MAG TPA: hypothetical protein DCP92_04215 [Nitrospiraceae bacterium]|nr:hypothetical protein [Nitrospiraceae bacterium]
MTGIRFYKASTNTGTHMGNLWTSEGTLIATAIFVVYVQLFCSTPLLEARQPPLQSY